MPNLEKLLNMFEVDVKVLDDSLAVVQESNAQFNSTWANWKKTYHQNEEVGNNEKDRANLRMSQAAFDYSKFKENRDISGDSFE